MAFRQRSGTRPLKVVVAAVALAAGLEMVFPVPCFLLPVLPRLVPTYPRSLTPPLWVRVYHYTNKAGYDGILRSGYIRPSDIMQGDAFYGSGVYATELDPSVPVWDILKNNYDNDGGIQGRGESKMDRADYVFAFDVEIRLFGSTKKIDNAGSRSVYCIGGGDNVSVEKMVYYGEAAVAADVLKSKGERVFVYHYTNKEGYESILANGYISPSNISRGDGSEHHVSGVCATLLDPTKPICTILHDKYGRDCRLKGRGKDILDQADYVLAFSLPVEKVKWANTQRTVLSIGDAEKVEVAEAFYHGKAADAFKNNSWNHTIFESEEEAMMSLQVYNVVNEGIEEKIYH